MNEAKMMTNLDAFLSYGLILEDYLFQRDNSVYIPRVLETKLRLSESYLDEMLTNEVKKLEETKPTTSKSTNATAPTVPTTPTAPKVEVKEEAT